MPFKSKAQARMMWEKHPELAQEMADKTPDIKKLPEYVKGKKRLPVWKGKQKSGG